jgi:hypothetical protein
MLTKAMTELLLQQFAAYIHFINSLRSKETKIHYTNWLSDFLHYLNISCDGLLNFEVKQLQQKIINYVIDMRDNRKLSPNTMRSHISAIQTFLVINNLEDQASGLWC